MEILIIFIFWLFLSVIAGVIASKKGRFGFGFFLISVLLSPLIGIIAAWVVRENRTNVEAKKISSGENKKCPYCAEIIKKEAVVCHYCGRVLADEEKQEDKEVTNLEGEISEQDLMVKYGITFSNEKYIYKEYRYDNLHDAVNYAEKQV